MTYLYPDHLRARATLWLWDLRDIGFIGIGAVFSIACFRSVISWYLWY